MNNNLKPTAKLLKETALLHQPTRNLYEKEKEINIITHRVEIGDVLNEKYRLTGILTENTGEASIFVCEKENEQFIAKVYRKDHEPKQEVLDIIKTINSPYVISVIDSGRFKDTYFEILPYYKNRDLARRAPMNTEYIENTVIPNVIEGLKAIHEKGLIHRDIKPNNIFISDDERYVILGDFGISRVLESTVIDKATSIQLSEDFASPEAYEGIIRKEVDYYSFGITLLYLVTGQNPYHGLSKEAIILHKFKNKVVIPASIGKRLSMLIKGLTEFDSTYRWGYQQVKKWLNNEEVPLRDTDPSIDIESRINVKPYSFEKEMYYKPEALAIAFGQNWESAKKHLYRGFVSEWVKQFGQDIASDVMDCEEEKNQDLGVFKLIYTLNNQAPLIWKGQIFKDLSSIGEAMYSKLPQLDEFYLELFTSDAMDYYLEKLNFSKELVNRISELNELLKTSGEIEKIYYDLMYIFYPDGGLKFEIKIFDTVEELAEYLYEQRKRVDEISDKLLKDPLFFAWLEKQGFINIVAEWRDMVHKNEF